MAHGYWYYYLLVNYYYLLLKHASLHSCIKNGPSYIKGYRHRVLYVCTYVHVNWPLCETATWLAGVWVCWHASWRVQQQPPLRCLPFLLRQQWLPGKEKAILPSQHNSGHNCVWNTSMHVDPHVSIGSRQSCCKVVLVDFLNKPEPLIFLIFTKCV